METHETVPPQRRRSTRPELGSRGSAAGLGAASELLTWLSGLVLALSSFMGWYAGVESDGGPTLAVIGWHTGALGKLVFFVGLAVLALVLLERVGIEPPRDVPDSLIVIVLGSLATIFVLVRLISIPDAYLPLAGRGIGIWVALLAAIGVIVAGLLRAGQEL